MYGSDWWMYSDQNNTYGIQYTVWPESLAGRNFGGLLKLWHLVEYTLAVEKVLAIMIFIAKWLIERAGNLTGLWVSFDRSYHSDAKTENRLPIFLGKWPTTTLASFLTATAYTLFGLHKQANSSPTYGVQNPLETCYPRMQLWMVNSMPTITLARPAAGLLYTWKLWLQILMTTHCKVLADYILVDCSQNRQSTKISGHTVHTQWSIEQQ